MQYYFNNLMDGKKTFIAALLLTYHLFLVHRHFMKLLFMSLTACMSYIITKLDVM